MHQIAFRQTKRRERRPNVDHFRNQLQACLDILLQVLRTSVGIVHAQAQADLFALSFASASLSLSIEATIASTSVAERI